MIEHGFFRTAVAAPRLRVADCRFNAERTVSLLKRAATEGVDLLAFPELGLTGYTCGDLFHNSTLQRSALEALEQVRAATESEFPGVVAVGLPVVVDGQLFNAAAVLNDGAILGVIPKRFLPNYGEFYDARYFSSAETSPRDEIFLLGEDVPFGTDLLFEPMGVNGLTVAVEICEDLWVPVPPSSLMAVRGATVLVNLSGSNETIAKAGYRRQLVQNQSARCVAAYLYAGAGVDESTTDLAFGGHCLIAENGTLLAESERFRRDDVLVIADVDLQRLEHERVRMTSFHHARPDDEPDRVVFEFEPSPAAVPLRRIVEAKPFVPRSGPELRSRCEEIFHIQVTGLAKRLEHIGKAKVAIGVSGGLDSTLALLVACRTMDALGESRENIRALTMPGFGTTDRTLANARKLMDTLGVSPKEIDIRTLCLEEMRQLAHKPFGIDLSGLDVEGFVRQLAAEARTDDLTFENVQARVRTNLLMNTAFVVGTGDLSELALGWCTYNADHMSMYNPNVSVPKTLVKFLVDWAARNEFEGPARETLLDVVNTDISPELLPAGKDGKITQRTEEKIGPYELVDFFLFYFLRYGCEPAKILFLASQAEFEGNYSEDELKRWLRVFLTRFFANQFKRSCLPDGPKVGSVSLSPRGDWRMPADAVAARWIEGLESG